MSAGLATTHSDGHSLIVTRTEAVSTSLPAKRNARRQNAAQPGSSPHQQEEKRSKAVPGLPLSCISEVLVGLGDKVLSSESKWQRAAAMEVRHVLGIPKHA